MRKDGLHSLIFMQCGPIVYKIDAKQEATIRQFHNLLHPRQTNFKSKEDQRGLMEQLIHDE